MIATLTYGGPEARLEREKERQGRQDDDTEFCDLTPSRTSFLRTACGSTDVLTLVTI